MSYKAIICDLDGTLLNTEHRISEKTKDTIKIAKEKGYEVVIATGRHFLDANVFKEQLGLETYLISSNGSRIHNEKNEEIYSENLEEELYKGILDCVEDKDISRHIYTDLHWYLEEEKEEYTAFYKETGFSHTLVDFEKLEEKEVIKLFFMCKDLEKLLQLERKIFEKFGDKIELTLSSNECLEVMKKNVSKGKAIKRIMENLGIELRDIIAFGDGMNDYEMLKLVGKGILMGNSSDRLKESLPNNEITLTNSEDGVAVYLEKIL